MSADDPERNADDDALSFDDDVTGDYEVDYVIEQRLLSNGCVLGDRCCCPHVFHTSDECYSAESADLGGES